MNTVKSLLNQLCGSNLETRKEIEARLKNCFTDPLYISNSELLPENDTLKADARITADAFEAVTNGMCNNEILAGLENIERGSFFSGWRFLTETIHHIYCGNTGKAEALLEEIEEGALPGQLKSVLRVLSGGKSADNDYSLSPAEELFIREIASEKIRFKKTIGRIKSDLENSSEERFTDNITILVSDFCERDSSSAKSLTIWAFRQFGEYGMSPELFLENVKLLFGEAEAFRLGALAFADSNYELCIFFWIKALTSLLRSSYADMQTADIYLEIIAEKLSDLNENTLSDDIITLLYLLEKELTIQHPQLMESYTVLKSGYNSNLKQEKTTRNKFKSVQLELFS